MSAGAAQAARLVPLLPVPADLSNVTRMFGGRSYDSKKALTDEQEQASFRLSQQIVAITLPSMAPLLNLTRARTFFKKSLIQF